MARFTPAIENALRALQHAPLARASGGYGQNWPHEFIALKTAKRVIEMGFAASDGKFGGKRSRLLQTDDGRAALKEISG